MEIIPAIILLIINLIIYFIICGVLYRRKAFTCISIRSPKLLILNIFGNFCMGEIVILTSFLSDNQKKNMFIFLLYYEFFNHNTILSSISPHNKMLRNKKSKIRPSRFKH